MVNYSFLKDQISLLRKELGKKNVIQLNKYILLKDIKVPRAFSGDGAVLCLEIPEGYGFGMEIQNVQILLDKKKELNHLHEIAWDKMPQEVQNEFHIGNRVLKSWYWVCFYIRSGWKGSDKSTVKEIPLREFPYLMNIVLQAIQNEDKIMLTKIKEMNLNRDEFLGQYKNLMNRITLENNWKKISWMYT